MRWVESWQSFDHELSLVVDRIRESGVVAVAIAELANARHLRPIFAQNGFLAKFM